MRRTPELRLDLSASIELKVVHDHWSAGDPYGVLTLRNDRLELSEPGNPSHEFSLAPKEIDRITRVGTFRGGEVSPDRTMQTLHLAEKTRVGTKFTFSADPAALYILIRYVEQTRSQ